MPYKQPLHKLINVSNPTNRILIEKWMTALSDLKTRGITKTVDIDPVVARRYAYDYYGLLAHLNIDKKYHYPHMLVNNLTNPTQFKGDVYTIDLLDLTILNSYYAAFSRK